MAAPIPAALKSADISRFALRATQLEKPKPIIAYWCNYWIVNQIITNNLQNADDECKTFTMGVMDKLEQFKAENPDNDAITDDLAGKAYIEQFGLETFQRAENAIRVDKASRQTAETFQASATFLELLQIFGALDPEISTKVKFAKYHALRIAKALKAGEDPNLSNPKPEVHPEESGAPLNSEDVEMLDGPPHGSKPRQPSVLEVPDEADRIQRGLAQRSSLDESLHPSRASSIPRPPAPKVEEAPDEADRLSRNLAQQSSLDQSLHPSRAPSVPRTTHVDPTSSQPDVSPLVPPFDRKPSSGGNYFPEVPSPLSATTESAPPPDLPSAPQDLSYLPPPVAQSHPPPPQQPPPPTHQTHFLPPNSIPLSLQPSSRPPAPTSQPPPPQLRNQPPPQYPLAAPPPQQQQPVSMAPVELDEAAIMKAQKHARWAISALNFEDVNTAVKELRGALESLGQR